ncbi:ethanolamine utilization protein EutQ (cupin superfamily) [Caballeronia udeis]|jgi:ethanolamine utilization protein EutQ (cupin superfamily)|uniref:Ethanolamine utilization protein EutQ (Cupin superfamily) n=1 Tax=Caballeronia udeis TaxID=1232866 RepID=A0ABW8MYX6_9BURK
MTNACEALHAQSFQPGATKKLTYEETLLLISGRFAVSVDGATLELMPGQGLWIARGSVVSYSASDAVLFFAITR